MRFLKPHLTTLLVWHYPVHGELSPDTEVEYGLFKGSTTLNSGQVKLSALPRASSMLVVIPMEHVVLANINLPKLSAHRRQAALSSALEEHLLGDVTQQLLSAAPLEQGRIRCAAIVQQSLINQCLTALPPTSRKKLRMVAEGLWLKPGEAYLHLQKQPKLKMRLLCRNEQGETLVLCDDEAAIKRWQGRIYFDTEATSWIQGSAQPLVISCEPISREAINLRLASCTWNLLDDYHVPQKKANQPALSQAQSLSMGSYLLWAKRLFIGFVLINLIAINVMAALLNHDKTVLQERAAQIVRHTLPGTPVIDPALQMKQALARAQRKAGQVSKADFLLQMSVAAKLVAQHRVSSINYAEQQLRLTLTEPFSQGQTQAVSAHCQELGLQCSIAGRQITLKQPA